MSENVVALPGYAVPTARGEPVADVVAILEKALEDAKSGVLVAVAIAKVMDADGVSVPFGECKYAHRQGAARDLIAAMRLLNRRFETYMFDE